jgi:hypothetical protein
MMHASSRPSASSTEHRPSPNRRSMRATCSSGDMGSLSASERGAKFLRA